MKHVDKIDNLGITNVKEVDWVDNLGTTNIKKMIK